jgi:hypothetical protein
MKPAKEPSNLRPAYLLLTGLGAVVAHIVSEFAAMGSQADGLVFSARHLYLGLAAVAGIAMLALQGRALVARASNGRDLKRLLHTGLATLPFGGRGAAFFAVTAFGQFAAGMLTEVGEGNPIAGHSVAAGIFGALCVVMLLALFTKAIAASLPALVEAITQRAPLPASCGAAIRRAPRTPSCTQRFIWFAQLFNRPPPRSQFATASF